MEVKRIRLKNLTNTRDLGGFPAYGGKMIIPHRLIRSGELKNADLSDLAKLKNEYGLHTVVDLRTDAEREQSPDPVIDGVTAVVLPVLDSSFFGIARDENAIDAWMKLFDDPARDPTEVFKEMYRKLLFSDYVKPYYRSFFDILLENTSGSVLWHCSAGKDRAGVATILAMMALGVSREHMIQDYMMTGPFTKRDLRKLYFMIRFFVPDKRRKKCFRILLGVKEEYVRQLFDIIDTTYGSNEGYLKSFIGLSEAEINTLRAMYLH
jgi:protein-tyrosine phosphatase